MPVYGIWNNKGGVGKSYLTFQIAAEYAVQHPDKKILVIDLCPQANSSAMLLGGMASGENVLSEIYSSTPLKTISGYISDRIINPYNSPLSGANYITQINQYNRSIPENLFLVVGDEQLEIQSSKVSKAAAPGPHNAWQLVHLWIRDLITDITTSWNETNFTVFIDCNPSFSIYTELAMSASDCLLIPFSADGSSIRAVRAVLTLVYGTTNNQRISQQSDFHIESQRWRMSTPKIYMYIGNRLTQMNHSSASAFKTIVNSIGKELWDIWNQNASLFCTHTSNSTPSNRQAFNKMFQYQVNDANTASVVSGVLGIPITKLTAGSKKLPLSNRNITVNQTQLDKQVPNIKNLIENIE
ncbi:MAG: ParA family protein [Magnetococcales bacterium]|nr:ParA family protein [Magnetococcales bacterium]